MKLYYFETPNGFKACLVAKHLGSPVEYVKVNLAAGEQKQPDFLAINPNGRIPALVDGDTKVWERPRSWSTSPRKPAATYGQAVSNRWR